MSFKLLVRLHATASAVASRLTGRVLFNRRSAAPCAGAATVAASAAAVCLALASATGVHAQPTHQPSLLVGMTAPLSGPASSYGRGLQHGIQLAIARANESGGIDGRKLELLALDDRGDAAAAADNTRELMRRGALALTGVHGARAATAVAEVLATTGPAAPPLLAPATGAEGLREPLRPAVFHLRAGTFDEMNAAMLHLDTLGITRYALVSQEGVFGDSARFSLEMQLIKIGLRPVARHSMAGMADAKPALAAICAAQPQVVVLALNETLALAAIEAGRAQACSTQYLVFSETGAALAERAASGQTAQNTAGLLVTQVVPHPANLSHPLVAEYQRAFSAHGAGLGNAKPSYPSIEGYQAMRVLQEALRACAREVGRDAAREAARACLTQALSNRSFDVAGQRIHFGSEQRQARPFVEMSLLDGQGRFRR